jgi:hypothetical protein
MFLPVDLIEVDVLVVDVLELDVLGGRQQRALTFGKRYKIEVEQKQRISW